MSSQLHFCSKYMILYTQWHGTARVLHLAFIFSTMSNSLMGNCTQFFFMLRAKSKYLGWQRLKNYVNLSKLTKLKTMLLKFDKMKSMHKSDFPPKRPIFRMF